MENNEHSNGKPGEDRPRNAHSAASGAEQTPAFPTRPEVPRDNAPHPTAPGAVAMTDLAQFLQRDPGEPGSGPVEGQLAATDLARFLQGEPASPQPSEDETLVDANTSDAPTAAEIAAMTEGSPTESSDWAGEPTTAEEAQSPTLEDGADPTETGDEDEDEEDAEEPAVSQEAINALAEIQTLLAHEGLDDLARDHVDMARLIEQLKGIVVTAEEVRQALEETDDLRRRKRKLERDFALPEQRLPYGALSRAAATDGTPVCRAPRAPALQTDIDRFCAALDTYIAANSPTHSPPGAPIPADGSSGDLRDDPVDRTQLLALAEQIRGAGEEPLKAIFTEPRRRAWLNTALPGVNALEGERSLRIAHNIVLRHAAELRQLREHYRDPRRTPPPPLRDLLTDMDRLSRSISGRLESLPALFDQNKRETLTALIPGIVAYVDDRTVRALSGAKSINQPKGALEQIRRQIEEARNFQTVVEASRALPEGLHRVFLLHWSLEELGWFVAFQAPGNPLALTTEPPRDRSGFSVGQFLTIASNGGHSVGGLRKAVRSRNDICHRGEVWQDDAFQRIVAAYDTGLMQVCQFTGVTLDQVPVAKRQRAISPDEMRERLYDLASDEGFDRTALDAQLRARIAREARELATQNPEITGSAWRRILHKHTRDYVLFDVLQMTFNQAMDLVRRIKPNLSEGKHQGHLNWMCRALFEKNPEDRERAQRDLDSMLKERRNHG